MLGGGSNMIALGLLLAAVVSVPGTAEATRPRRIDVNCGTQRALERALARTQGLREVEFVLHGVCAGNYVITRGGVSLSAATPGSGLAAPADDAGYLPVLEIVDVSVRLFGMILRGGPVGVHVRGWNGEVVLTHVDAFDQSDVGVLASVGAKAYVFDSTVRDGESGIIASSNAQINLQRVVVRNRSVGVVLFDKSSGAMTDTTIENSRIGGLNVVIRSDFNVLGGTFRENAQVHINANDWSSVNLLDAPVIGSQTDTTLYSLGTARHAVISSGPTDLYGSVAVIDHGSIHLGNTTLHGDLLMWEFSDAVVRGSQISGIVYCGDGSQAICSQTTSAGTIDCPSQSCGSVQPGRAAHTFSGRKLPALPMPPAGNPGR